MPGYCVPEKSSPGTLAPGTEFLGLESVTQGEEHPAVASVGAPLVPESALLIRDSGMPKFRVLVMFIIEPELEVVGLP